MAELAEVAAALRTLGCAGPADVRDVLEAAPIELSTRQMLELYQRVTRLADRDSPDLNRVVGNAWRDSDPQQGPVRTEIQVQ